MSGARKKINHRALFKPRTKKDDNEELSHTIIISARRTGVLNLSSKGLATGMFKNHKMLGQCYTHNCAACCCQLNIAYCVSIRHLPTRIWTINELTDDEIGELHFELDRESKEERWWEQEPLKILDLGCNSLTVIDAKIEYLCELTTLDLHSNLLKELPTEIGTLNKLRKLNLSDNKLEKLPVNFYNLTELQELNMKSNNLTILDFRIGDLVMLIHLNMAYNNLEELPIGMGYLVRLVSLDLSHNKLIELPPDVMSMRALQTLNASFNHLELLPPFSELRKVETVMLQSNNLTKFPDMSGCTALKELHLSDNTILEIDMCCLEGVGRLKKLILANNKIGEIPEDIVQLISLELFDLSSNNISLVPSYIGIMPNLKQFLIHGNNVRNIRVDIIRCGSYRILKHIRESTSKNNVNADNLLCSCNSNINIYPDKYTLRNTKLLTLAGQNLLSLPEEVLENAKEAEVTLVDLSRNKLSELPRTLFEIITVTDVKLSLNRLSLMPEWIGEKYKLLQVLDVSKNCLESLPQSISYLKYIREINISYNRFTEIPKCLCEVKSLELLIANNNMISHINIELLKGMERLAHLNLANNNIEHVPPELGNLRNLRTLLLSGNCFKQPRQAILMKSTDEILDYLRSRILS